MYLIRDSTVDITRYLPEYILKDAEIKGVLDTSSEEHERMRICIDDIFNQFFVSTATWGLSDWERIYGIIRDPDSTYDERRSVIKSKILGIGTITNSMMNHLINQFAPAHDAKFIENVSPGTFRIEVQNAYNADKIKETVDTYKPAHLSYTIALTSTAEVKLLLGGAVQTYDVVEIGPADEGVPTVENTQISFGGFVRLYSVVNV